MTGGRQLVSFVLIAYRQERFVREAIAAAFAQTHHPLEIILSDDCSDDGTFSVMQEMAASYKGPHRVVLNRNDRNLGLTGNLNRALELSSGGLIVVAAGDDVSFPERAELLYRVWQQNPDRIMALQSAFDMVNEQGTFVATVRKIRARNCEVFENASIKNFQSYLSTLQLPMSGATFAYNRRLFDTFGPLPQGVVFEDNVITLRALLTGGMWVIDRPLIRRRMHGGNLMVIKAEAPRGRAEIEDEENRTRLTSLRRVHLYKAFISEIQSAEKLGLLKSEQAVQALEACRRRLEYHRLYYDYSDASLVRKLVTLSRLRRLGERFSAMKFLFIRLIPWPILRSAKVLAAPLRRSRVDPVLLGSENFGVIDA